MALSVKSKTFHVAALAPNVATVWTAVSPSTVTVASAASMAGISQDESEHRLSLLVDEGLMTRTIGDRNTARYTPA